MGSGEYGQCVGLVGAGAWGKNLARNFQALGALHTICDANESILDQFEGDYPSVNLTSNFKVVLDNPEIKRIAIAAPAIMHYSLAQQALQVGKDVYVEKPLCLNSQEGEELIRLAETKGCILMVGHLLHYHPCVNKLQELLQRGELGAIQYIVSNRLNLGRFRTEENALWNFAPHDISLILSICGDRLPQEVRCMGAAYLSEGVADTSLTTLSFDGGTKAHVYVSWLNPFKEQKLTVVGSQGMAVFDDTQMWEDKLILYRNHVTWAEGKIPQATKPAPEKVGVPKMEPLREECRHFLECCERRTPPRTDGQEGLRVLKVLQAAQASLNEHGEAKDPACRHPISLGGSAKFFAHSSAVIDSGAQIGEGCKIWHFSHIMSGAKLGNRCNIGQNVLVSAGVDLGDNVKVQNNVSLYSGVVCERDVFLGPSVVFTNVKNPRSEVSRRHAYATTIVRRGATVGANSTILCGIEIGMYAFVAAGAVVTRSIKPFALVLGNPARQVGWMSRHGHKLDLPPSIEEGECREARCPETEELYRLTGDTLEQLSISKISAPEPVGAPN